MAMVGEEETRVVRAPASDAAEDGTDMLSDSETLMSDSETPAASPASEAVSVAPQAVAANLRPEDGGATRQNVGAAWAAARTLQQQLAAEAWQPLAEQQAVYAA